jgi:hypothetical protein
VVETTNLLPSQNFMGSWKNLKVTERFTRISPTRVNYQFTAEDPDTWAAPWGGEYDFAPLNGIVYEYACHEGNYALPAILAGARRKEQEAAAAGPSPAGNSPPRRPLAALATGGGGPILGGEGDSTWPQCSTW